MKPIIKTAKHKRLKKRKRANPGKFAFALFLIILSAGFAHIYNKSYIPVLATAAKYRAEYILKNTVNSVCERFLAESGITYDSLIKAETDPDSNTVILKADLVRAAGFKLKLVSLLNKMINGQNRTDIMIPLGNLLGSDIFSGIGPVIRTRLVSSGSADADFKNSFTAAGINQTRHIISIEITATLSYLLPGALSNEISVTSDIPIAESIIAGKVPENFTNLETDIESLKDDLLNLR